MNLKGTRTENNLMKAFAGESQARNRYTYFASVARKEDYVQISNFFIETAENEKEHAKRFYKFLDNGVEVEITASFPKILSTTAENLKEAAAGENMEWSSLYPEFARVADEEGFAEVAKVFRSVSKAEKQHEKRYLALLENIEKKLVFKKEKSVVWKCGNCGWIYEGPEAPDLCDACAHVKAHFELLAENW